MKVATAFATTLVAVISFPLLAQQSSPPTSQPGDPASQQQNAPTEQSMPSSSPTANSGAIVEMSPVSGELVSKLDSKTAKAGDSVAVQTRAEAKTTDGTEIPKGSKLVGHVLGVQSSGAAENSQVVLQFDHLELKGGKNLPVHSQIQSIAPAGGTASASSSPDTMSPAPAGGSPNSTNPSASGASSAPQSAGAGSGAAAVGNRGPAAGTVVARTGKIDIRTTSIPGVLLANNAPGQQDPRMAQASSILLGAKQDIQLDGGTQMTVGVSPASGASQ